MATLPRGVWVEGVWAEVPAALAGRKDQRTSSRKTNPELVGGGPVPRKFWTSSKRWMLERVGVGPALALLGAQGTPRAPE